MSPSISFPFPKHLTGPTQPPTTTKDGAKTADKADTTSSTSTRTTGSTTPSQPCTSAPASPKPIAEASSTQPSAEASDMKEKVSESTLTRIGNLYKPLSRTEQTQLLQLAHFIHIHAVVLNLSAYDLLTPVEESLLSRSGAPYEALKKSLCDKRVEPSLEDLVHLAESSNKSEFRENYHKQTNVKRGTNANEIHGYARPIRVQDSRNEWYTWIRGYFGMSPRIVRNDVLLKDPLGHAERLRVRGGRKDVFVSGWIASRVESAERVERCLKIENEKREKEIRESIEKARIRKIEKEERERRKEEERRQWIIERDEREQRGCGVMTRGRRSVCYAESEEDSGDAESAGEEFVCEEVLDGSDNDEEMEEEVEEEEDLETRVIGRVRVSVSDRTRRAERRAKARRAEKDLSEDEEDGYVVRRSKRLRSRA